MKRIKMSVLCPQAEDPTSWYRGIGPLSVLQKTMPELEFLFPNPINWPAFKLSDILFMQRPCAPEHFQCLTMAKDCGIPVIVDLDDDNTAVPESNPTFDQYNQPHMKDALVKIARNADVIMTSTSFLQKKYSIYNKNVVLVPNALDDGLLHTYDLVKDLATDKTILWRGTPTHHDNLAYVEEQIIELAHKHKDWKFAFFGYKPLRIKKAIRNFIFYHMQNNILEYMKNIVGIRSPAMHYPLAENDHSLSRSHVSWLEATLGGKLFIGPSIDEFKKPGVLNFANPAEFKNHIEAVIEGQVDVKKLVAESWAHLLENYRLTKVNEIRREIITKLVAE